MIRTRIASRVGLTIVAAGQALTLAGCSGSTVELTTGALSGSATATVGSTDLASTGSPSAVYSVIASKALTCWFGPNGPLKSSHIFHADVTPPSDKGETADIVLHERDLTQPTPRGARAYRILLTPNGSSATQIEFSNSKFPEDLGDALRIDVLDWTRGGDGCRAQVVRPPQVQPNTTQASSPTKKKPAAKARQAQTSAQK